MKAIGPDHCSLDRTFADGGRLMLFHSGIGDTISISNDAWPRPQTGGYQVVVVGSTRRTLSADPRRVGSFGLYIPLEGLTVAEIADAAAIEILAPEGREVGRYELVGAATAAKRLSACTAKAAVFDWAAVAPPAPPPSPPPSGYRHVTMAKPVLPLSAVFADAVYPPAALAAGEQGTVRFVLAVDVAGRVADCTISSSSGSETLDMETCRLMRELARFEPARDAAKKPVADSFFSRVTWRLPPPETEAAASAPLGPTP
ncbi:energy transducer TonB [Sphingosinicella sp. BN140058]|uniref:energy transducer TonB n=1 Tax=Sphingosinicella sp. BN140058 TaxID=1892855 RepID=UPI0013ED317D|nr:energy transducer TonB [Sphingosinicella sp. BN140058]